jgi:hypothetical protein
MNKDIVYDIGCNDSRYDIIVEFVSKLNMMTHYKTHYNP